MGQSLKQIKNRIRSIENTRKVTNAMEMVSVSKLNRIDKMLLSFRPYYQNLEDMFCRLVCSYAQAAHPLLEVRQKKDKIALCVITSDNGLCGLYNQNILRAAEEFIRKQGEEKISLIVVGRKGINYFRKRSMPVLRTYPELNGRFDNQFAGQLCELLIQLFLKQEADEVYAAYTSFKTAITQRAVVERLLSIELEKAEEVEYILEPDFTGVLDKMVKAYISNKVRMILLQAFTAEHAARAISMKTATDNAKELLDDLVMVRNKVRQANITQEIMEIISSAEALRG